MRMKNPGGRPGRKHRTGAALLALAFIAVPLLMMLSCYPGEITSIEELDIVGTIYNPKLDYSKFNSYVLPDTIAVIDDRTPPGDQPLTPQFEALILQTIESRMTDLGYTRVDSLAAPDVGLAVGIVLSEQYVITGGGYWGCGYYPYYPCWGYYPPVATTTSYETGTLLMDMLDFTTTAQDTLPIVWQGAINGLASSKSSLNESRIIDGINQSYKQSPYLKSAGTGGP